MSRQGSPTSRAVCRARALMSRPEVVGVGVGKDERGRERLVLLVEGECARSRRRLLPRRIAGVPTAVMETGVIKVLGESPRR